MDFLIEAADTGSSTSCRVPIQDLSKPFSSCAKGSSDAFGILFKVVKRTDLKSEEAGRA